VTPTTVSVHLTTTPAPEPSSVLLLALGTLGLCSRRRPAWQIRSKHLGVAEISWSL
jgi:hypothetical protein